MPGRADLHFLGRNPALAHQIVPLHLSFCPDRVAIGALECVSSIKCPMMTSDVGQTPFLREQQRHSRIRIAVVRTENTLNGFSIENVAPGVAHLDPVSYPAGKIVQVSESMQCLNRWSVCAIAQQRAPPPFYLGKFRPAI